MRLIPKAYNGFEFINSSLGATATFPEDNPNDWNILGIASSEIARSQNFPERGSKDYSGQIKIITVNLSNIDASRDPLVIAMDVLGRSQHRLYALDDYGNTWYVWADAIQLTSENIDQNGGGNFGSFSYALKVNEPIWKRIDPLTDLPASQSRGQADITGSGSIDFTPLGNIPALPDIVITPLTGSSGFLYQRFIQVINNAANALVNYPTCITGAGLDTAALISDNANKALLNGAINSSVTTITYDTVTGTIPSSGLVYIDTEQIKYTSKNATQLLGVTRGVNGTTAASHADNAVMYTSRMAVNGNDLRVYVDGAEVKRWLSGINTSATKVWINQTQPANSNMTLGATIAGAGAITSISIQNTATNNTRLALIPTSGNVLIGSEIFVYTGVDVAGRVLTGVTRAERQTSAAAHAVADTIKFVTHDIWLYYGAPDITDYVVDDTYKPAIELTSTNSSWVYAEFGNVAATRTGGWSFGLLSGFINQSTGTVFQQGVDPFTAIGFFNSTSGGLTIPGSAQWKLYQPCGVSTITETGWKLRLSQQGFASFTFQKSLNDSLWTIEWTETSPSPLALTALNTHSAVALGATYSYIRFVMNQAQAIQQTSSKESTDITLVIVNTPTITVASEQSVLDLNTTITNPVNGLEMSIRLVMTAGQTLTVSVKNKTITLSDGTNQINSLQDMPIRPNWFQLEPGVLNSIGIVDSGHTLYDFAFEDRTL